MLLKRLPAHHTNILINILSVSVHTDEAVVDASGAVILVILRSVFPPFGDCSVRRTNGGESKC